MVAPDNKITQILLLTVLLNRQIQRLGINDIFRQGAVFNHQITDTQLLPKRHDPLGKQPCRLVDGLQQRGLFIIANRAFLADQRAVGVFDKIGVVMGDRRDVVDTH